MNYNPGVDQTVKITIAILYRS